MSWLIEGAVDSSGCDSIISNKRATELFGLASFTHTELSVRLPFIVRIDHSPPLRRQVYCAVPSSITSSTATVQQTQSASSSVEVFDGIHLQFHAGDIGLVEAEKMQGLQRTITRPGFSRVFPRTAVIYSRAERPGRGGA